MASRLGLTRLLPKLPNFEELPTSANRDIALDVVRAWSLLVVVFGHFIMQIFYWQGNIPISGNTLSSGNYWPFATWVFQVMPLFFAAGGAVNAGSWSRFSGSYNLWLWRRVRRFMKPTAVFLLVLAAIFSLLTLTVPTSITDPLVSGMTGPLWFLSVYITITALTPISLAWWQRSGLQSVLTLFGLVVVVDYLRLNVADVFGVLNLLVAWILVHQLGYWYNRGVDRFHAKLLIGFGLLVNISITNLLGWYPTSLVGIPTEKFSNMAPPTVVLVCHALVLFGGFVLLAPRIRAKFVEPKLFRATARAALFGMTIYLWHMSVLVGWLSFLHALKLDLPTRLQGSLVLPAGVDYWVWLVPSTIGFAAILYLAVRLLWPIEYMNLPWFDQAKGKISNSMPRAVLGVIMVSLGLLAVSGAGFSGFPLAIHSAFNIPVSTSLALFAIGVGLGLLRQPKSADTVDV